MIYYISFPTSHRVFSFFFSSSFFYSYIRNLSPSTSFSKEMFTFNCATVFLTQWLTTNVPWMLPSLLVWTDTRVSPPFRQCALKKSLTPSSSCDKIQPASQSSWNILFTSWLLELLIPDVSPRYLWPHFIQWPHIQPLCLPFLLPERLIPRSSRSISWWLSYQCKSPFYRGRSWSTDKETVGSSLLDLLNDITKDHLIVNPKLPKKIWFFFIFLKKFTPLFKHCGLQSYS